jgi:hypothetical protein
VQAHSRGSIHLQPTGNPDPVDGEEPVAPEIPDLQCQIEKTACEDDLEKEKEATESCLADNTELQTAIEGREQDIAQFQVNTEQQKTTVNTLSGQVTQWQQQKSQLQSQYDTLRRKDPLVLRAPCTFILPLQLTSLQI